MSPGASRALSRGYTIALALSTGLLVFCIIVYPERAFQFSLYGLTVWWKTVFPALLPFLIVSELMIGFGVVRALGTLLDPLMRHLFKIPGIGGWAMAVGAVAGMPAGAHVTARLRADRRIGRAEGERLLALSHMGSPYLMIGVIGAGFLHDPRTGAVLAVVHYVSGIAVGLAMRFYGRTRDEKRPADMAESSRSVPVRRSSLFVRSIADMHRARLEDGRSFGKLLGDAVSASVQTLMMIGGAMMIFSVLLGVLTMPSAGGAGPAASAIAALLEIHIGAFRLSETALGTEWAAAVIGAALGWSGLSCHAQVAGAVYRTDLRYFPFFISRLIHAALAFGLTFALWNPLNRLFGRDEPSFAPFNVTPPYPASGLPAPWSPWAELPHRLAGLVLFVALMAILSRWIGRLADRR
jgi:nucleoside recognition membrane protein YjiH